MIELFPYVILGILIGEALKFTTWIEILFKRINDHPLLSIFNAALLGIISPLCTYGTVPIVLQLFKKGIPFSPLVTFLSVSSLMNPQLFFITWGGINLQMAVVRVLAVLIFGILIGILVNGLSPKQIINPSVISYKENEHVSITSRYKDITWKMFLMNTWRTTEYVGFYIVIGIILGAVIDVFIPDIIIYNLFNADKWYSVPLAGLLGIPLYACGGGTIPLINSLMLGGMSAGSALSFFIVGPATRFTPIMALMSLLRPVFLILYIIVLIIFSILAGYIYNLGSMQ